MTATAPAPYVLICAGEDSGDVLGAPFVQALALQGRRVCGTGGTRMQAAGLEPLADFEELPVSGFGDVLPRYFRLHRIYDCLAAALQKPECIGLIAVDYPGFNMKLCALAKRLQKPVLYVAPPQVWAWKKRRAKQLRDTDLAVLFEFERAAYQKFGCTAQLLRHPFLQSSSEELLQSASHDFLLLPGSRKSQALRNMDLYLPVVRGLLDSEMRGSVVKVVAARASLVDVLKQKIAACFGGFVPMWISVVQAPSSAEKRRAMYASACSALTAPGTATLELALSGCPQVVATVPDTLTYVMGKLLICTPVFAMPNILLGSCIPEYIVPSWACRSKMQEIKMALVESSKKTAIEIANKLIDALQAGNEAADLVKPFIV